MRRIVIVGAGFAGVWSALSAARLLSEQGDEGADIEIVVVAPRPSLDLRPRFYEPDVATMTTPLGPLFDAVGVRFVAGTVGAIEPDGSHVFITDDSGRRAMLGYDRLILAAGSHLARPDLPGLAEHAFSIDQRDEAAAFETHLQGLATRPASAARNTVVVVGGGFTGVEIAMELPVRLRAILGDDTPVRVVIIEQTAVIGPELGEKPRPVIAEALASQGIECRLATAVTRIDAGGVDITAGNRIETLSVLWTGGMRASGLTRCLPGERDALGRLCVDRHLRVPGAPAVFAAGDTARAATDDEGHHTLMSCQHAMVLGRFAGHNAAADLVGAPLLPYAQERYGTCLDLGPWGSIVTAGWDRAVQLAGPEAKAHKRFINGIAIMPPPPIRAEALAAAAPLARSTARS
ncbi:MAG TPA: FAD-dependent oxidoreductase [Sphingobium sp.]|nr:FAD-dependent oxidoreductase [Sphingobium sp.]